MSLWKKMSLLLGGVLFTLLVVELAMRLSGAFILLHSKNSLESSVSKDDAYKIMCLGDSMTVCGANGYTFPYFLQRFLDEKVPDLNIHVINKGVSGADSLFILSQIDKNISECDPDMVVVMMGFNDALFSTLPYDNSFKARLFTFFKRMRLYKLYRFVRFYLFERSFSRLRDIAFSQNDAQDTYSVDTRSSRKNNEMANPEIERLKNEYMVHTGEEEWPRAFSDLKKALEIEPDNIELLCWLGEGYYTIEKYEEAEDALFKAMEINPDCPAPFMLLGTCYLKQRRFDEAEEILKRGLSCVPPLKEIYNLLADCYKQQGQTKKLKELMEETKSLLGTYNGYYYGFLANLLREQGRIEEARKYYKKASEYRLNYYNPSTRHNYRKLKEILDEKGIQLVCIQYPVREVKSLKKMFDSSAGIIFVDNEEVFKRALESGDYDDYFSDNLGGDFGHCTPRGNRLLAESIADTLIREYFSKARRCIVD